MNYVNTRGRIKAAALPLFAKDGFAGTSIAAIETAAGLAPRAGAFYRHFPGKEALMEWVATKAAARGLDTERLAALTLNVFGSWLYYLTKRQQGVDLAVLDRDTVLEDWATRWSNMLDNVS